MVLLFFDNLHVFFLFFRSCTCLLLQAEHGFKQALSFTHSATFASSVYHVLSSSFVTMAPLLKVHNKTEERPADDIDVPTPMEQRLRRSRCRCSSSASCKGPETSSPSMRKSELMQGTRRTPEFLSL